MVLGSSPVEVTSPSNFAPASSKEFLDIQVTIECGFILKRVCDMTRTYSEVSVRWNSSSIFFEKMQGVKKGLVLKAFVTNEIFVVYWYSS